MKKSKILALTLSAISTGILISCAKPAQTDNNQTEATDGTKVTDNNTVATNEVKNSQQAEAIESQAINISPEQETAYLTHVANDMIVPTYNKAVAESQLFHNLVNEMCQSGVVSVEQIAELRRQWLVLATTWAKAEAINFGPATENMNNLFINYFPDERKVVHRSVKELIADSPNITPEQFVDQSAIVQGLPALEDILYTNDSLDVAQCNYVISASSELNRRLSDIAEQWKVNSNTLLDTANPKIGMNQYFNGLLFYIENLKSTGVDKPLALTSKKKGHVPAHIAGQSQAIIQAKLDMLQQLLADQHLLTLIKGDKKSVELLDEATASIEEAKKQLVTLPADITTAEKANQQVLYDNLTNTTKVLKRGILPLFGVQIGFNSTDGD
ncbi:MAG: peptidase M75 [Gammaproteobacteria bacterium]|nr:MAG: peptidase M75 [Gammaproteobacteria bacterium]